MKWINSSLVTSDLFLDLELSIYGRSTPSLQTILNLNEIVELVVLKEKLLMPTTDDIVIVKHLNAEEIEKLGGTKAIDWAFEIKNLGKANLKEPIISTSLKREGVLVLDTEQEQDKQFREFGDALYRQQWFDSDWILKTVGLNLTDSVAKEGFEQYYLTTFNNTYRVYPDSEYWRMCILAVPDLGPSLKKEYGQDFDWTYQFYREVEAYTRFARKRSLGFSDNAFMQPFVALQFRPSPTFLDIFYGKLKDVRNEEICRLLEFQEPWIYSLPPLTAILLQRCGTLEDLPVEMLKLRSEFQNLRQSLSNYERKFEEADTLKAKLELKKEFQNSVELFVRKVKGPKTRTIKTVIDFTVEQSDSIVRQDFTGSAKAIGGKIAEYVYSRRLHPWMNSFLRLYDRSLDVKADRAIYEKVFRHVNLEYFDKFQEFARNSQKFLEGPAGRSVT